MIINKKEQKGTKIMNTNKLNNFKIELTDLVKRITDFKNFEESLNILNYYLIDYIDSSNGLYNNYFNVILKDALFLNLINNNNNDSEQVLNFIDEFFNNIKDLINVNLI